MISIQEKNFLRSLNSSITDEQLKIYDLFKNFTNTINYSYYLILNENLVISPYEYKFENFVWIKDPIKILTSEKVFHLNLFYYEIVHNSDSFLRDGQVFLVVEKESKDFCFYAWKLNLHDVFYIPEIRTNQIFLRTVNSGSWEKIVIDYSYNFKSYQNLGAVQFFKGSLEDNFKKIFNLFDNDGFYWVFYDERLRGTYFRKKLYYYPKKDGFVFEKFKYNDFVGWYIDKSKSPNSDILSIIDYYKPKTKRTHFDMAIKMDYSEVYFWSTPHLIPLYDNAYPIVFYNSEYTIGSWINVLRKNREL